MSQPQEIPQGYPLNCTEENPCEKYDTCEECRLDALAEGIIEPTSQADEHWLEWFAAHKHDLQEKMLTNGLNQGDRVEIMDIDDTNNPNWDQGNYDPRYQWYSDNDENVDEEEDEDEDELDDFARFQLQEMQAGQRELFIKTSEPPKTMFSTGEKQEKPTESE